MIGQYPRKVKLLGSLKDCVLDCFVLIVAEHRVAVTHPCHFRFRRLQKVQRNACFSSIIMYSRSKTAINHKQSVHAGARRSVARSERNAVVFSAVLRVLSQTEHWARSAVQNPLVHLHTLAVTPPYPPNVHRNLSHAPLGSSALSVSTLVLPSGVLQPSRFPVTTIHSIFFWVACCGDPLIHAPVRSLPLQFFF